MCVTEAGNLTQRRSTADPSRLGRYENWAFNWPANRRILYNRCSADAEGKPCGYAYYCRPELVRTRIQRIPREADQVPEVGRQLWQRLIGSHLHCSLRRQIVPPGVGGTNVITVLAYGDNLEAYGLPKNPTIPLAVWLWKVPLKWLGKRVAENPAVR